ncbi:MAG: Fe(2+)-trafficking protein [Thermoanaerobaculia bacterium]|nr:Fe(2+)-trafficking protein [Thermoanaerobaculia bacterium]
MSDSIHCARCGRADAPALGKPPLRGALGAEIASRVCADCWQEWQRAEVMVINELRLNFMDPEAPKVLETHLRQFLALDPPAGER